MFWDELKDWYAKPYRGFENMSAGQLFLLFGLALAIAAGWRIILHHIEL